MLGGLRDRELRAAGCVLPAAGPVGSVGLVGVVGVVGLLGLLGLRGLLNVLGVLGPSRVVNDGRMTRHAAPRRS